MSTPKLVRVAEALKGAGADALVLLPGPNLYYTLGINQMLRKRPIIYVVFPDGSLAASLPLLEVPDFRTKYARLASASADRVYEHHAWPRPLG